MRRLLQSIRWHHAVFYGALAYIIGNTLALFWPQPDEEAVYGTAAAVHLVWTMFAALFVGRPEPERRWWLSLVLSLRLLWLTGWLLLVLHVMAAFAVVHGWSHSAAYDHTRQVSGFGWGLFVNYLVVLVWGVDAVWLCVRPAHYVGRPRWVGWTIHGFIGFVLFNATVVYGSEWSRTWGLFGFGLLMALYLWRRLNKRPA